MSDQTDDSTDDADAMAEFTIRREFDVPVADVWRAWTNEDELAHWLGPYGVVRATVQFDVRVGGRYSYTMTNAETGEEYPTGGEFIEVMPMERLAFSWGDPGAPVAGMPVVVLTFVDLGDQTELVFHLNGYGGHPGDGFVYDGWDEALNNFGKHLAGESLT